MIVAATVTLSVDTSALDAWLTALTEAPETFPEFGQSIVGFLESGEEAFGIHGDSFPAAAAGHLVVRLKPSDGLVGLVTTFRARHPDFGFFEHLIPLTSEEVKSDG